jgi:hypothetical protein
MFGKRAKKRNNPKRFPLSPTDAMRLATKSAQMFYLPVFS